MKNDELSKMNILHLEDDPTDFALVREILEENDLPYNIVQVDNSEAYNEALRDDHFDIILSDYTLPSFDGFTALAVAAKKCPKTPFVFFTGTMGEERAIEALKKGASDYILKDNIIRLVPSIKRAVREAKRKDELSQSQTEQRMLEIKLLHAQKLELVGQLAAGIAHEINTPTQFIGTNIDFIDEAMQEISGFMGRLQEIIKNGPQEIIDAINKAFEEADWDYLSEELPQAISQSREGIKRVTSIVRAMKEFSHPGNREKESKNLNQIIKTTVTVARNEWKYVADVELDLDLQLPEVPLLVDEIGQVILNILVNAAQTIGEKLGPNPNGHKGTISITTRKVGDSVELAIRDSGMGIPEEARPRIFNPFFTTKNVGEGTGQGLAICHDVVTEKHGGSINFETEIGKGTRFVIQLPAYLKSLLP